MVRSKPITAMNGGKLLSDSMSTPNTKCLQSNCARCLHLEKELQVYKARADNFKRICELQEEKIKFAAEGFVKVRRSFDGAMWVLGVKKDDDPMLSPEEVVKRSGELLCI